MQRSTTKRCPVCRGRGTMEGHTCPQCNGMGDVEDPTLARTVEAPPLVAKPVRRSRANLA